ncbi:MAG: PhnD/SsuA/transferrin family substrate-binding protein [Ignavibacteriales bacterium]|nr:PhnD/SsuA/transferrin family substrate-binding protein [Ignavibacteriota bacterium]MCB0746395.1 PhnD/SsuA/transferrin family substrate-binding protein [Ignavibacteriota bacterium]MCB9248382.1 PhnD/SsuA/transferrin family substrate-binding protein [Ignavibacteriales bacterium]
MWKLAKIVSVIILLIAEVSVSQSNNNKKNTQSVEVGFSINLFSQVDIRDATVAIQMWGNEFTGSLGINYTLNTKIYDNNEDIITALKQNKLDLISLLSTDYFEISKKAEVEPCFINTTNGKVGNSFLLLVRKDKGIKSLADLKNKRINIPVDSYGNIIEMWLETTLNEKEQKLSTFFSEIKTVEKPSQALLPVFFNQIDACVVTEPSFNTMLELNPQLKKELIIIEKSPEFINGIFCLNKSVNENIKNITLDAAQKLTQSISGRQILSLFKSEELLKYKVEYIKSTKELYEKYKKIQKK